jgi:hypothetical protein
VEFDSGVIGGELPVDRPSICIATRFPRSDLRLECRCVIDTTVETLSLEYAEFNLGHVQPASSLGRVIELESIEIRSGLIWREVIVEGSGFVCIELVNHHPDAFGIRVVDIREFDHAVNPFGRASSLGDFDGHPASQWFRGEVDALFAIAFVPVVDASDRSRLRGERVAFVTWSGSRS